MKSLAILSAVAGLVSGAVAHELSADDPQIRATEISAAQTPHFRPAPNCGPTRDAFGWAKGSPVHAELLKISAHPSRARRDRAAQR